MESVDKIAKVKTGANDKPESDVKIISLEIKQFQNGSLKDLDINPDDAVKKIEETDKAKTEVKKSKAVEK